MTDTQGPASAGAAATRDGSIREQTTAGVGWSAAQKWAIRLTGFASVALLARMLNPQDFGLVAAATTIMPLLYLLSDLGFTTYVVQAESVNPRLLSTAFWFSTSAGVLLSGALVLTAPLVADVLNVDGLSAVLQVLAIAVLAVALGSAPTAILKRRMAFRTLALQSGVASVLGQVVAVVGALIGWGAWALVAQLLVAQVTACVLVWVAAKWAPTGGFSRHEFTATARFGSQVVGIEVIAILRSWGENAVIVLALGTPGLGYLNIAQRLIQISQDLPVSSVTPVTTVAFARIREGVERLRRAYLDVVEVTYAVAIPFVAVLAVASPLVIPLVFGHGWGPSIVPAQVWALASFLVVGAVVDHSLFYGMGRPGTWLGYAAATDALTFGVTVFAVRYDLIGVAVGFACVVTVAFAARSVLVARVLAVPWHVVVVPFARAVVVLVGTGAAVWAVLAVTPALPDVVRLVAAALVAGVAYWLLLHALLRPAAQTIRGLAAKVVAAVRGRRHRGEVPGTGQPGPRTPGSHQPGSHQPGSHQNGEVLVGDE
jgi:O-antigen/teichoic acid export membrane protein